MADEAINRIAEKVMGGGGPQPQQPPTQQQATPQGGQQPTGGGAPQQPQKPQGETPPTAQEKVAESSGPETEGDQADELPVTYKVRMGDGSEREMSESQIRGTLERYSSLNHQHAQYKPVMDIVRQLHEKAGADPKQIADFMQSALRAQVKNTKLGQQGTDDEGQKQKPSQDPIKDWEMENGVSLPPQYKEMLQGQNATQSELKQLKRMMAQVLQGAKGQGQQAAQDAGQAQQQRASAIKGEIKNNLNKMAQQMQFSDDQAKDFMTFMGDRGYTFEDFVDPGLTMRVGQDFRNALQSGDFDRLKKIAERRSAVAGSMGAAPTGGAAAGGQAKSEGDNAFDRMTQKAMQKRMLQ